MKHRLRYVIQQYKKHPQTILADILLLIYLIALFMGKMDPILASILGLILASYIAILYSKVSR